VTQIPPLPLQRAGGFIPAAFLRTRLFLLFLMTLAVFLSASGAASAANRYAVLVGIGAYSNVPPDRQLAGGEYDVRQMSLLLNYCGFQSISRFVGPEAKGARIRAALKDLAGRTHAGDTAVFYFSGRGSLNVLPGSTDETRRQLAPTLVPYDGDAATAVRDIPLDEIAEWSKALASRGVSPVVILDACYFVLAGRDVRQSRVYNPVPRCLVRAGRPRPDLWQGAGLFLSAANRSGPTYEWRADVEEDAWTGVFTDRFVNWVIGRLNRGGAPTGQEVLEAIRRKFEKQPGYMPGFTPFPVDPGASGEQYKKALFDLSPGEVRRSLAAAAPSINAQVDELLQQRARRAASLRIAINVVPTHVPVFEESDLPVPEAHRPIAHSIDDRRQKQDIVRAAKTPSAGPLTPSMTLEAVEEAIRRKLSSLPNTQVLEKFQGDADRVVQVNVPGVSSTVREYSVSVSGSAVVQDYRRISLTTQDPAALIAFVNNEIAGYFRVQALAKRLYHLADSLPKSNDTGVLIVKMARGDGLPPDAPIAPKAEYGFRVTSTRPGILIVLDRDGDDGPVEVVWPFDRDADNRLQPSMERRLPYAPDVKGYMVGSETPTGPVNMRFVLLANTTGEPVSIPALSSSSQNGAATKGAGAFDRFMAAHLERFIEILAEKPERGTMHALHYVVQR